MAGWMLICDAFLFSCMPTPMERLEAIRESIDAEDVDVDELIEQSNDEWPSVDPERDW